MARIDFNVRNYDYGRLDAAPQERYPAEIGAALANRRAMTTGVRLTLPFQSQWYCTQLPRQIR